MEYGKRVGLWIRVSSDMQVRDESPEVHLKRANDYATDRGWEVAEVYRLDGVSGGAIWDLPITRKMLYDIKTGHIEGLVFTSLERLGRDTLELLQFEKYFREHDACLISIFDSIDTSTSDGKRYFQGLAAQAEYERAKLSERVKRGIATRYRRGEIFTKEAPYGYRKVNKKLEPDPVEGPVVQLMFQLYLQNHSFSGTARELNKRGHRTSRGNHFNNVSVRRILTDTAVKGQYFANRSKRTLKKTRNGKMVRGKKLKPKDEWIEFSLEPLVTVEVWNRVQKIVAGITKPKRRTVRAYSGLLKCHDGTTMYFRSKPDRNEKPKYFCRKCRNKILAADLDSAIGNVINSFALKQLPDDAVIEPSTEIEQKYLLLESTATALQKIERENSKLIELFTAEAISLSEFKQRKEPLEERRQSLEREKATLEYELTETEGQAHAEKMLKQTLDKITWDQIDEPTKNEVLRTFVKEITLTPEQMLIHFLYVPATLNQLGVQR